MIQDAKYSDLDEIGKRRKTELEQYIVKPGFEEIMDDDGLIESKPKKITKKPEDADPTVKY